MKLTLADLEAMFSIDPLAPATVIDGLAGNTTGTLDWHFDSAATTFDFLADGESLVLTYTVQVTDDSATGNDTNTNTVTITIGGTNDQPTISADTASIAETDARLTDSGTLNIGDLDTSDTVSAQVIDLQIDASAIANGNEIPLADLEAMFSIVPLAPATVIDGLAGNTTGTLDWHFDSAATTFDFLADGESLVLTYTVQVTDDSATGNDTNTNTVTITIGGTNDQPTISADTASIAETDARLTDSGTLNIGDLDTSDTVSAQVIDLQIDASAIANGNEIPLADLEAMFSIDPLAPATVIDGLAGNTTGTLDWHFDSAATTFDFLADGESLVLTYTVEVTDDSATGNDTNTNTVTITIGGTNDQPTISADTASIAETDARLTDTGTLNIGDLDTSDTVSAQVIDLQIDASAIANGNEIDPADLEAMFSIDPLAPATVIDGLAATPQALSTGTSTALPPPSTSSQTANLSSSLTPFKSPMTPRLATTQTPIPSPSSPSVAPTISPPSPLIPPPSRKPTLD